jgi:hypothetical protein
MTKPAVFGKLVKNQKAQAEFIADYADCATRAPDQTLCEPSLVRYDQLVGRPPRVAVADGGLTSQSNERTAYYHGCVTSFHPDKRRKARSHRVRAPSDSASRRKAINILNGTRGLRRCHGGAPEMELGILANNLVVFGRANPSNKVNRPLVTARQPTNGRGRGSSGSLKQRNPEVMIL